VTPIFPSSGAASGRLQTRRRARANIECVPGTRRPSAARERVLRRQMPRRKATSGGKTLRTRGRFSTETSCCSAAIPRCKTGQVSQWMQTQVGVPDDPRVTAQGPPDRGVARRRRRRRLAREGKRRFPSRDNAGWQRRIRQSGQEPAVTITSHAAAALTLTDTIPAAAPGPCPRRLVQPRASRPARRAGFGLGLPRRVQPAAEHPSQAGFISRAQEARSDSDLERLWRHELGLPLGAWRTPMIRLPHGS